MAQQDSIKYIKLTGNPFVDFPAGLDVSDGYTEYYIDGDSQASMADYNILPTGTPRLGTKVVFRYKGSFTLNNNFNIFTYPVSANQLLNNFVAEVTWDGIQWNFQFMPNLETGLATGIIETDNIKDLAVTTAKIANDAVTTAKILDQNVTTAKLADDAVTTVKILDLNVTNNKIDNFTIDASQKVVAGSVTNTELANMADGTIKGNDSGMGAQPPSDISISTLFDSYGWRLDGNTGTSPGTDFIGTTDNQDLVFKVANTESGRIGWASGNVSFGVSTLASNTTGNQNVALGNQALTSNTTGLSNIGIGDNSLAANIGGIDNVGVGIRTLENNLANRNVAMGTYALQDNDLGNNNVAIGYNAGANIIGGGADNNVTIGYLAGATLNGGDSNTLIGAGADVDSGAAINRIALGAAIATADNQFALPDTVTDWKIRGNNFTLPSADGAANAVLQTDGSGVLSFGSVVDSGTYTPSITDASTNATINSVANALYMTSGNIVMLDGVFNVTFLAGSTSNIHVTLPNTIVGGGLANITYSISTVADITKFYVSSTSTSATYFSITITVDAGYSNTPTDFYYHISYTTN